MSFRSEESSDSDKTPDTFSGDGEAFLNCQIRKALTDDIPQLTGIENQSFSASDYPVSERLFRIMINNRKFTLFVAELHGQVVGYVCLLVYKHTCLIYSIAVDEAYRGRGIGKKLLETAEKYARDSGAEKVQLEVRCDNNAVKLYQRHGYSVKNIKRKYYGDNGDAFHMEKQLAPNGGELCGTIYINGKGCIEVII